MSVRVTFLGGLGEIGRNCAAIEIDGRIALIDVGLMFPEEDMLGVDLVFPDWSWLTERADDVECVILTHGHEDHVGALAYFLQDINVPVYGTHLTCEIAKGRPDELGVGATFRPTDDNVWVEHGPFTFCFVPVSHSIPDGAAVVFDTPEGYILHSGDFKLDPTPIDGRATDLPTFAGFGRRGVRLLMADSTNAEVPGFVPSERSLGRTIEDIVRRADGRVVAACFASHVHRVQQIVDAGLADGRKIAFFGRSMHRITDVGRRLQKLTVPEGSIVDIEELLKLPDDQQLLITTGSQGEPFAALSLMASNRHKFVDLTPADTVLLSATPIPGNERAVSRVISQLHRIGARVYHGRNAPVHVSGHGAQDELRTFLNVVRPQGFVPIHGEYRHLRAHAELAGQMGVPQIEVCEDGDAIVIDGDSMRREERAVPARYVYFDGSTDISTSVIRQRGKLADDGVVVVTVGVDLSDSSVILGPDVDLHGVVEASAVDAIAKAIAAEVKQSIEAIKKKPSLKQLQDVTRQSARKVLREHSQRKPVVIPAILEV
jgi:ribonuclease J